MQKFLAEAYASRHAFDDLPRAIERVRRSTAELTREGQEVRYLRTIFLPEDETCFHLFEGVSAQAVDEASRRAALAFDRIVEVIGDEPQVEEATRDISDGRRTKGAAR